MFDTLSRILTPPPIMGVTINNVFLSPVVRNFLYAVIAVLFLAALAFYFRPKTSLVSAARKAVLISFFCSGILAAVYADIGWSTWVSRDFEQLSGLSVEGKLVRIEGQLSDFTRRAGAVIKGNSYQLYAPDAYINWRSEYQLLPLRKRDDAPYVVVIDDPAARYDPVRGTFSRGDKIIRDMDLVLNYAPQVYVLRGH